MKKYNLLAILFAMLFVSCQNASHPISVQTDISPPTSLLTKSNNAAASTRYIDEIFPTVSITSNIAYSQSMDENGQLQPHLMDIYEADGDTALQRPVIIWAPGGGFNVSNKTLAQVVDYATTFAKRGYVTAAIEYRVREGQQYNGTEPEFPQVVREAQYDGQAAVRWFRANAGQYKIDVSRINIAGSSAGAFVALDVTYNYEDTGDNTSNAGFPSNTSAAVDISGAMLDDTMMQSGDSHVIIFHGTADPRVSYNEALEIQARAQAVGVTYELNAYQGAGHVLYTDFRNDIVTKTANFLFNNVMGASQPPVADAGADQTANVSDNVNLDGSSSFDPDGSIASYAWNFGDGATASGAVVNHTYSATGTYTASLTVTDNDGLTAQDAAIVTITDASSDVVNIIKADYKIDKQELNVEATSTMSPNAVLTLVGFGTMQYDAKKDKYKIKVKGINNPGTVTVT
ncbi:MAG: PKD domain-containing protein, partial [bacterium]